MFDRNIDFFIKQIEKSRGGKGGREDLRTSRLRAAKCEYGCPRYTQQAQPNIKNLGLWESERVLASSGAALGFWALQGTHVGHFKHLKHIYKSFEKIHLKSK